MAHWEAWGKQYVKFVDSTPLKPFGAKDIELINQFNDLESKWREKHWKMAIHCPGHWSGYCQLFREQLKQLTIDLQNGCAKELSFYYNNASK